VIKKFFLWGVQRKDARICSVMRPNASWNACRPPQVSVRNSTTIPVVFTGVSGASQALLVAATPRDLVGSNARLNPKLLELLCWLVPNTTLVDSLVNRALTSRSLRSGGQHVSLPDHGTLIPTIQCCYRSPLGTGRDQ